MIYVGLDLHKRYITACAVDATGTVVAQARELSTEWLQTDGPGGLAVPPGPW